MDAWQHAMHKESFQGKRLHRRQCRVTL